MGKYLLFHRHHVVKLLLWIGMEGGDIHYVIECASCCSQCCFQVFKSKPMLMRIMYIMLNVPKQLKDMLRRLDSCMSKNFWPISLIPSLP